MRTRQKPPQIKRTTFTVALLIATVKYSETVFLLAHITLSDKDNDHLS